MKSCRIAGFFVAPILVLLGLGLHVQVACAQTSNGILREVFTGIAGDLPSLTNSPAYPSSPALESIEPLFEGPSAGDNYGTRMRALLTAPATGNYIFWIATDDNGNLFLSSNESPASKCTLHKKTRDGTDVRDCVRCPDLIPLRIA